MVAWKDENGDANSSKEMLKQLQQRIERQRLDQQDLISSLQGLDPNLVSSLDLSLKVLSVFSGRKYTPISANLSPNPRSSGENRPLSSPSSSPSRLRSSKTLDDKPLKYFTELSETEPDIGEKIVEEGNDPLSVVRSMVAVCLLERVPFTAIDSWGILRKLENDPNITSPEKNALLELGGEMGPISAVEIVLRSIAEETGGIELENFEIGGKSGIMVLGIDRNRLVKELPESSQLQPEQTSNIQVDGNSALTSSGAGKDVNGSFFPMVGSVPRPPHEIWMGPGDPHLAGMPPLFPGPGPMPIMGPRGGPRVMGLMGMPRVMGVPPLHRPMPPNVTPVRPHTEEEDMKDLQALLNKKTFKELQKSKTGEELLDLIHRPTAKETAVAAKFSERKNPSEFPRL